MYVQCWLVRTTQRAWLFWTVKVVVAGWLGVKRAKSLTYQVIVANFNWPLRGQCPKHELRCLRSKGGHSHSLQTVIYRYENSYSELAYSTSQVEATDIHVTLVKGIFCGQSMVLAQPLISRWCIKGNSLGLSLVAELKRKKCINLLKTFFKVNTLHLNYGDTLFSASIRSTDLACRHKTRSDLLHCCCCFRFVFVVVFCCFVCFVFCCRL